MERILYFIFENSIYAAIALLIVLPVRFLLRKTPKIYSYILWGVVFFRLLCPVAVNTGIGIIPEISSLKDMISHTENSDITAYEFPDRSEVINDGFSVDTTYSATPYSHYTDTAAGIEYSQYAQEPQPAGEAETYQKSNGVTLALFFIWLSGTVVFLTFYFISLYKVRRKIYAATRVYGCDPHVYESDRIDTSFVFGFIKPRIYIPTWLDGRQAKYVIKHEQVHLRRRDYIIKPLAFIVTAVYWFNPAAWVSYILMCRDMEMSCDETVVRDLGMNSKGEYCRMLYDLCPKNTPAVEAAINGSDVKSRIKHTLTYKRPTKLVAVLAALAVVLTFTACAGTNDSHLTAAFTDENYADMSNTSTDIGNLYEQDHNHTLIFEKAVMEPDMFDWYDLDEWYEVTGYTGTPTNVVIPSEYNGLPVKCVKQEAFLNCDTLVSLKLSDKVDKIGFNAFENCTTLEYVDLSNVKYLDFYAFRGCSALQSIDIPDTIIQVEPYVFADCVALTNVTLPQKDAAYAGGCFMNTGLVTVTWPPTNSIADEMFKDCKFLRTVILSEKTRAIEPYVFAGCSSLTEINITDNIQYIKDGAFKDCTSLKEIYIPSGLVEMGKDVFEGCPGLVITDKRDPGKIDYTFFSDDRSALTDIVIPDGITAIAGGGFADCENLRSVVIPNSVKTIGNSAFADCRQLHSVIFGNGLQSIGNEAFVNCIYLSGNLILPDSVNEIGKSAFAYCGDIERVELPENLTIISEGCFEGCAKLSQVDIPDGVKQIKRNAFLCCGSLREVVVPYEIEIEAEAFTGCADMMELKHKDGSSAALG